MKTLNLCNNNITKAENLRHLMQLPSLDLSKNYITKLGEIAKLPELERFYLGAQKGDDFKFYNGPSSKIIQSSKITFLKPFYPLEEIEILGFLHNPLESLNGIQDLWYLRNLDISWSYIEDLTPL
ncbi:MAG: hypothetical protein EAX96_19150 [Candidatus Lokiarchaeota archaeon]|nr:hypothetical protein [Candidatus Lokiarchaeota archaeon]